ncbi:hypothetical protein L1887_57264 [Cichorium endivia]|nr:hypothetical protein L1887_57264 [Cichorium endivia]
MRRVYALHWASVAATGARSVWRGCSRTAICASSCSSLIVAALFELRDDKGRGKYASAPLGRIAGIAEECTCASKVLRKRDGGGSQPTGISRGRLREPGSGVCGGRELRGMGGAGKLWTLAWAWLGKPRANKSRVSAAVVWKGGVGDRQGSASRLADVHAVGARSGYGSRAVQYRHGGEAAAQQRGGRYCL